MITITKKYEELEAWAPTLAADVYDLTIDATTMTNGDYVGSKLETAPEGVTFKVKFINVPSALTDASGMFNGCREKLISIDCSALKNVTNATNMFHSCNNLTNITGMEAFTKLTDANSMFMFCKKLISIDCSAFKNVTNAGQMFYICESLAKVTGMEAFAKVTICNSMFYKCAKLTSINTSAFKNATTVYGIFTACTGLTSIDLSPFNKATDARWMLQDCTSLKEINWGVIQPSNVTDMFLGTSAEKTIKVPSNKDTGSSPTRIWITNNASAMKLTNYSTKSVYEIPVIPFNGLTNWMPYMLVGLNKITIDCSTMTNEDHRFANILSKAVANALFDITLINLPNDLTDATQMFNDCPRLTSIDIEKNSIVNASYMFYVCSNLKSVNTSNLTRVNIATQMFAACKSLTSIDISNLTNVTNASGMFFQCSKLTSITGLEAFTKVTNASSMFQECSSLTSIDVSNLTSVTDITYMFFSCSSLKDITWGSIKPATKDSTFLNASATKKILVSDQATADWIKTNASDMSLTNYSTNLITDIPTVIPYEKLNLYAPAFKPGSHDITIDCSTITNADHEIGEKLKLAPEGVTFNITLINVPDNFTYARNMFLNCKKLISVTGLEAFTNVENTKAMFFGCSELTSIDIKDFKNVTDASSMFWGCSKLTSIDTSAFINVTNAEGMFRDCIGLTSIDTQYFTKVTNAYDMFSGCSSLTSIDVSGFTKVVSTDFMLDYCTSLTDITWGNIRPAENDSMFSSASASKVIKVAGQSAVDWLKANETKMHLTNYTTEFLPIPEPIRYEELTEYASRYTAEAHDITIDCSTITNEDHKIGEKLNLAPEGATFNVTLINVPDNFTNAINMFFNCKKLTSIDTSVFKNITDATTMFYDCSGLTSIDTKAFSKVTNAGWMFNNCSKLTSIDTKAFAKVTDANGMLQGCTELTSITWGSIKPAKHTWMFHGASAAKVIKVAGPATADWIRTNETDMALTNYTIETLPIPDPIPYEELDIWAGAFLIGRHNITIDCSTIKNEDHAIGSKLQKAATDVTFNVKLINVPEDFTNARNMFRDCTKLASIDCSGFKNATDAAGMFLNCTKLTSIDCSAFKNVTNTWSMFKSCTGLTSIIGMEAFAQVKNARTMFSGCTGLASIDCSAFKNVTDAAGMFLNCTGLASIDCSAFKNVTDAWDMFKSCTGLTSIDCSAFAKVTNAESMFQYCTGLTSIDCSAFKNVTNAYNMFYYCTGLTSITGTEAFTNVTKATQMFYGCKNLTSIDCSAFKNVTDAYSMFSDCRKLISATGTEAFTKVTDATQMFAATNLIEIDIRNMKNIQISKRMFQGCSSLTRINFGSNPPIGSDAYSGCPIKTAFVYTKDPTSVKNTVEDSKAVSKWPDGVSWQFKILPTFKFIRIA